MATVALKNTDRAAIVDDVDVPIIAGYDWYLSRRENISYAVAWAGERRRTCLYMHRMILGFPRCTVDHKDNDGLNNRRTNLRVASRRQQMGNTRKFRKPTSSKYKGVCFDKARGKWKSTAGFRNGGKRTVVNLGRFNTEKEAAEVYNRWASAYFGEFAKTNILA